MGEGDKELVFSGDRGSFRADEIALEMDAGGFMAM